MDPNNCCAALCALIPRRPFRKLFVVAVLSALGVVHSAEPGLAQAQKYDVDRQMRDLELRLRTNGEWFDRVQREIKEKERFQKESDLILLQALQAKRENLSSPKRGDLAEFEEGLKWKKP